MASPLPGTAGTDNEAGYLIPARDGIVNMLKSASKSSSVKRVVMTASSAAVVDSKVPTSVPYCPTQIRLICEQSDVDGERLEFIDLGRWEKRKSSSCIHCVQEIR